MMLRKQIQEYLSQANLGFKEVGGMAKMDLVDSKKIVLTPPCCFVGLEKKLAKGNTTSNAVHQKITRQIGIIIVVRNVIGVNDAEGADEAEDLSERVQNCLIGLSNQSKPSQFDYVSALQYAGGNILSFSNGFLFWRDIYEVDIFARKKITNP